LVPWTIACDVATVPATLTTTASCRRGWQSRVGTVTCSCAEDEAVTAAGSPAIVTVAEDVKPVPAIVAAAPSTSTAGVIDVIETATAAVTVIAAVPDLPSLVAVIVVLPLAMPVTRPPCDTEALVGSELVHTTARPVRTLPLASLDVAVNCCVLPAPTVAVAGVTTTVATGGGDTVMTAELDLPSLVAVIVALPAAIAVARPVALTLTLVESDVAQVTARPASALPLASRVEAVSCCVAPMASVAEVGDTVTTATGTGMTVIDSWPCLPPTVAITCV
jgi:hypothetical protein